MNPMLLASLLPAVTGGGGGGGSPFTGGLGSGGIPVPGGSSSTAASTSSTAASTPGFSAAQTGFMAGGIAGGIGGYLSSRKARKKEAERKQIGSNILNSLLRTQEVYGQKSEGKLNDALSALAAGTAGQLRQADQIGRGAKRRAMDREQQNYGQVTQGLTNAGLASTTRSGNLARAVRSDTDRALLDIDDALAQLKTGIIGQGAAQQAAGLGDIANLYQNRAAQHTGVENARFQLHTGMPVYGGTSGGGQSMAGLGPLLALALGGKEGASQYGNLFAGGK